MHGLEPLFANARAVQPTMMMPLLGFFYLSRSELRHAHFLDPVTGTIVFFCEERNELSLADEKFIPGLAFYHYRFFNKTQGLC
jgi:hypothetical protein